MLRPPPTSPLFPYTTLFRSYLYHPEFRAAQEQAKYEKLIRFAEKLEDLRAALAADLDKEGLDRDRVSAIALRSEEHTSELQSHSDLVCRLLLEKKKNTHVCA